jgi:hypothetical protein
MVFRPTMVDVRPPVPSPEAGGLIAVAQHLLDRARGSGRTPKPAGQPA